MRMPGTDGGAFLSAVRERHPDTVRYILSGHADSAMIVRTVAPSHRFYAKPCSADQIVEVIEDGARHLAALRRHGVSRCICGLECLPVEPAALARFGRDVDEGRQDADFAVKSGWADAGIVAQLVRIARGGFFGIMKPTGTVGDAIHGMGLHLVRELLRGGVFTGDGAANPVDLDSANRHGCRVGWLAGRILDDAVPSAWAVAAGELAGMLHGVGNILPCAAGLPHEVRAEVGGSLLGLWNFPEAVWKAVAFQYEPAKADGAVFGLAWALYMAHVLAEEDEDQSSGDSDRFAMDEAWLAGLGLGGRVDCWREWCRQIPGRDESLR
jgi:hypothetical protein